MNTFRRYRSDLVALGLYTLLTFLLTWPMLFQMSTHLIGSSQDTYINPWASRPTPATWPLRPDAGSSAAFRWRRGQGTCIAGDDRDRVTGAEFHRAAT